MKISALALPVRQLLYLCGLLLALGWLPPAQAASAELSRIEQLLTQKSFKPRTQAVELLAVTEQAEHWLTLLLDGQLYYHKKSRRLLTAEGLSKGSTAHYLLSGEALTIDKTRAFKKVRLNNRLRGQIRQLLAGLRLNASDPAIRLTAIDALLDKVTPQVVSLVQARASVETDSKMQEKIALILAIATLQTPDAQGQQQAITTLADSLEPAARNALTRFVEATPDAALQQQAEQALLDIDQQVRFYGMAETLYFGLSLGSVLVLAGIGLAITFGVMGVINMAHGELIMLGAYTTYVVQQLMPDHIGWSLAVAVPAAFLVSGLVGIGIERGVIRFLYGRPLETLLATFGISLVLQQLVRSVFSPLNRSVETPDWMSGMLELNPVLSLTTSRLYIIVFCLMVFFALLMVLKRTPLGLQVRAVSQNRAMARAMGVRSQWVDALTFGLGSGIAGVAGVALSQLTNVGPNLGQAYIIDSFMVVVFGGVGNLWGTLVAGLSLGVANKVMEPWAGAVLAKILVLIFIILFIQKRPRGLFPQRGRAAEG